MWSPPVISSHWAWQAFHRYHGLVIECRSSGRSQPRRLRNRRQAGENASFFIFLLSCSNAFFFTDSCSPRQYNHFASSNRCNPSTNSWVTWYYILTARVSCVWRSIGETRRRRPQLTAVRFSQVFFIFFVYCSDFIFLQRILVYLVNTITLRGRNVKIEPLTMKLEHILFRSPAGNAADYPRCL